ncbi:hypothetical protein [Pseudonocardia acaciae]|uniref:hypothetical protein n=1 Tax=Pseudonocardia acaciae TaxID=551276 RepID=UPI00048BC742|nr:hypothetical protein [Pseudonocardia acaciae]
MQSGPGESGVDPAVQSLAKVAPEFEASSDNINRSLPEGVSWRGSGAAAASGSLRGIANTAQRTGQAGQVGSGLVGNYSTSFAGAKAAVAAPVEQNWFSRLTDWFGATHDHAQIVAQNQALDAEANRALKAYENQARQTVAAFPDPSAPPRQPAGSAGDPGAVVRRSPPVAGAGAASPGGAPSSGAPTTPGGGQTPPGGNPHHTPPSSPPNGVVPAPTGRGSAPPTPAPPGGRAEPKHPLPPTQGPLPSPPSRGTNRLPGNPPPNNTPRPPLPERAPAPTHLRTSTTSTPETTPPKPPGMPPPTPPALGARGPDEREHRNNVFIPSDEPFAIRLDDEIVEPVLGAER